MSIDSTPATGHSATNWTPPRTRSVARRVFAYTWVLLVAAGIGFVMLCIVLWLGLVEGEEFSPETFQSRNFKYYEIPLVKWQITGVTRTSNTPAAAVTLTQKNWIPPRAASDRWDLVWVSRGAGATRRNADAALLVDQLRLTKDGAPFWSSWSADHPEMAKVFWPTIAKLSRRELYLLMPRLFELTRGQTSADDLQKVIDATLRADYESLIADMRAAGKSELADALFDEAKEDNLDLSR